MATVNIGDIVQIILTWDTPTVSVAQNVWHYLMASGAGADSDDLLAGVLTNLQVAFDEIDARVSDQYEGILLEARVWDFANDRFDGVGTLAVTGVAGTDVADPQVNQVAALGRIVTEVARRQGRTYVPGFTEAQVTLGLLIAPAEAALAAYLAVWDTDISITGGLFNWCTFNVEPTSPVFETASVASGTVIANSIPSTLGKRKVGVGL